MEQKKKNEKDVLVVRDEKTGEISVVAGLDSKGYPKTAPAKAEHSQDFLRFDRHGDVVDNFFRNFYRQCKEPTRFGFYRVAADMADAVLPVIKDLLKDPAANAEMLAAHKVDTSEYQKQAETENVKQESDNEPLKKTEEMEQKKEEQKQEVQQPQTAEAQDEQQPQKQEKQNLIADDQVDWEELRKCGIDREKLSEKDLKALMNYGKTGLVTVKPTFGYESYELQARLSFQKAEDGKLKLTPHFIRDAPRLDVPYKGYSFTDEDRNNLKHTGNLGKMVSVADERTGEFRPSYISIDRLTNEIVDVPANKVRIPDKIGLTPVSSAEKDILRAGLALPKEVTLKNLTAKDIQEFYLSELERVSPSSVIHYHANIHKALKYAVKIDLIDVNPADKVERPKKDRYVGSFYDADEVNALFEAAKGTKLELPILFGAFYGLRRSEAIGLKWDAIDFEQGTISVKRTVTSTIIDGKYQEFEQQSAKTKSSLRTLPLIGSFREYFMQVKEAQELNKQVCGNCYNYEYDGFVFVDELGERMRVEYLTNAFPKFLESHGLRRMRFHDLRHSCASLLLANGVPLKHIQEWLGHSDFTTTANIYAHLDYKSKITSAQAMETGLALPEGGDFGSRWREG